MALIDVTRESLTEVIKNYVALNGIITPQELADFILNYYTPVVPVSPSAFTLKDVISGDLVPVFSPFNSERKCREMKQKYFPTAQFKVVALYEAAE